MDNVEDNSVTPPSEPVTATPDEKQSHFLSPFSMPMFAVNKSKLTPDEQEIFTQFERNRVRLVNEKNMETNPQEARRVLYSTLNNVALSVITYTMLCGCKSFVAGAIDQATYDGLYTESLKNKAAREVLDKEYAAAQDNDYDSIWKAFEKFLITVDMPEASKDYAQQLWKTQLPSWIDSVKLLKRLTTSNFFDQWASGEFTYSVPYFKNEKVLTEFLDSLALGLTNGTRFDTIKEKIDCAQRSVDALKVRLLAHEKSLWQKEEQEQKAQQERQQRQKEDEAIKKLESKADEIILAQQRAVEESKKRQEFLASAQPYPLGSKANDITNLLSKCGNTDSLIAGRAKQLCVTIEKVHGMLDIRDEALKEFGDILFSSNNLIAAANACGLENQVKQLKISGNPSNEACRNLRNLYDTSAAVHQVMDKLMRQEDGILLLATLTQSKERSKNYATQSAQQAVKITKLRERLASAEEKVGDFARGDLYGELKDERDVKDLIGLRGNLAKELRESSRCRREIEDEIRKSFQERKRIPTKLLEPIKNTPQTEIEFPSSWLTPMEAPAMQYPNEEERKVRSFHAELSEAGEKFISICNDRYPYFKFDIKRSAAPETFKKQLDTWRDLSFQFHTNMETQKEMIQRYGFRIGVNNDCIYHPEYKINVQQAQGEKDAFHYFKEYAQALWNAIDQSKARFLEQRSLVHSMVNSGVGFKQSPKGFVTFTHPSFGEVTLTRRGYFSNDDFITTQNLLNQVMGAQISQAPTENTAQEKKETPVPALPTWPPEEHQTAILFDTNTLSMLAAPRDTPLGKEERSWLDLIKSTARLPNVKIIIPAVIADWELRGQIPVYDEKCAITGFEQVDPRFRKKGHLLNAIAEPIDKFLKSASRVSIAADGSYVMSPGANQNIIIVDTPADKSELYDHIRTITHLPKEQQVERFQNDIAGKDKGEEAITRIINTLPNNVSGMVISDDMKYLTKTAPVSTGKGMPVGHASTICYMDAELSARASTLKKELSEDQALSVYRLSKEIKDYWQALSAGVHMGEHCETGKYAKSHDDPPDTIYTLIEKGVVQQKKRNGTNGNGSKHGNGNWANADLKNSATSSPISQGEKHYRPSQGPGASRF